MRFRDEHRFPSTVEAVAALLVDPGFQRGIALPDLELLDVVDHSDDGEGARLSLRYEYVGQLDPIVRRLLGGDRLTWIQQLDLDRARTAGHLTFEVEGHGDRLHGSAGFTLRGDAGEMVWELDGEVTVAIPLVRGTAERRIVAGVLRRLDIQARQMGAQLQG